MISALLDGVRVLNLYVPNGSSLSSEKYPYKLAWLGCLKRYLDAQAERGEPLCMVGDFNIALEARDIHDPDRLNGSVMASDAERSALCEALGDRLQDAFRMFEPDAGHWSWWDYRTGAWDRDRGWRIDHIYLCDELMGLARSCTIHKQERGNPNPVITHRSALIWTGRRRRTNSEEDLLFGAPLRTPPRPPAGSPSAWRIRHRCAESAALCRGSPAAPGRKPNATTTSC